MKTNAENMKLFEEARILREQLRNSLHNSAMNNIQGNVFLTSKSKSLFVSQNKIIKPTK